MKTDSILFKDDRRGRQTVLLKMIDEEDRLSCSKLIDEEDRLSY